MTQKKLYTYHEVRHILNYPTYNAVKIAVSRGKLRAESRPGDRKKFVPRAEILRVLRAMGLSSDAVDRMPETSAA